MTNPADGTASGEQPGKSIAVFLLDDHEVVRRGVRDLLEAEPDIRVVGEAGTASSALKPDVAALDVRLPDGDGVSVCREIRSRPGRRGRARDHRLEMAVLTRHP